MFNGYHGESMVNNVIAYGVDGTVFDCALNFPENCHASSIIANLPSCISNSIGVYMICVDQSFLAVMKQVLFWLI